MEKPARSYSCRLLRLTLLAPDIVEAILNCRQPLYVKIEDLLKPFLMEWLSQTLEPSRGTFLGSSKSENHDVLVAPTA